MKTIIGLMLALGLILTAEPRARAADGKLSVVAAENFYGDVARQIGGDDVAVASIMSNPDQDPHLFETTPSVVKQIAGAQIVILNGADYDPWMDKLLKASPKPGRSAIIVADLVGKKAGDNPSVVRPRHHAGGCQGAGGSFRQGRSRAQGRLRCATQNVPRFAHTGQ
jgi:zinc/manganese transport system substrate-binding protein